MQLRSVAYMNTVYPPFYHLLFDADEIDLVYMDYLLLSFI